MLLDDDEWNLLLAFLVGTLRPSGPYAFLAIRASSSGKSMRCELLKAVIDLSVPMRSSSPKSVQDLINNGGALFRRGSGGLGDRLLRLRGRRLRERRGGRGPCGPGQCGARTPGSLRKASHCSFVP